MRSGLTALISAIAARSNSSRKRLLPTWTSEICAISTVSLCRVDLALAGHLDVFVYLSCRINCDHFRERGISAWGNPFLRLSVSPRSSRRSSRALPASARSTTAQATVVKVTAGKPTEFSFKLSTKTVKAGAVTFKVTNGGAAPHDFKICAKGGTADTCTGKVTALASAPARRPRSRIRSRRPGCTSTCAPFRDTPPRG